jgi:hypothetical protein
MQRVVMVNECVGPDGDGCTAKAITPAKYGTQLCDGGKLCRACYGKKYQRNKRKRVESPPPSYNSSRHVESMHSTARTVALLESPHDREATIKTLLMVLGCRCAACMILSRSPASSFFSRLLCASVLIIRLRASGAATRTIFRTRRTYERNLSPTRSRRST